MYEKVGEVVTVNLNNNTARVKFPGLDGLISSELQIVGGWEPRVGQKVFCSFTEEKTGFILGPIQRGTGGG